MGNCVSILLQGLDFFLVYFVEFMERLSGVEYNFAIVKYDFEGSI